MKRTMLTLNQAVDYLKTSRKITVSRQAIYTFMQRHLADCEKIGAGERPAIWLIPTRLLETYRPSARHQATGRIPKKAA